MCRGSQRLHRTPRVPAGQMPEGLLGMHRERRPRGKGGSQSFRRAQVKGNMPTMPWWPILHSPREAMLRVTEQSLWHYPSDPAVGARVDGVRADDAHRHPAGREGIL